MVALLPDRLLRTAAVAAWVMAAGASAQSPPPASGQPILRRDAAIVLDAASSEVDYANNKYLFRSVTITQGDLRVNADEARATGTDFDNATWEFKGKVRISLPNGGLRSDLARVQFRNNLIASARIEGQPAEFEQQRPNNPEPARGRARTIDYDVATNLVKFTSDAWLSDGRNEIRGNELVYNLLDQKVRAQSNASDGSGGIRITIRPGSPTAKPPAPPPATAPAEPTP